MSEPIRASRRTRRRPVITSGDAGVTLIEVLVGMSLMAVVLSLSTAAVVHMYGVARRVESVSSAQAELHAAFQRLDREVRYATDITAAADRQGTWYVEYRLTQTGTPTCVGLRLSDGQLQRSTWTENQHSTTRTAWLPLASGVRAGSAGVPFELLPPDATIGFQRLRLRLVVGADTTSAQTDVVFTALNTIRDLEPSACMEGRP